VFSAEYRAITQRKGNDGSVHSWLADDEDVDFSGKSSWTQYLAAMIDMSA
jgi:hypothetical protein